MAQITAPCPNKRKPYSQNRNQLFFFSTLHSVGRSWSSRSSSWCCHRRLRCRLRCRNLSSRRNLRHRAMGFLRQVYSHLHQPMRSMNQNTCCSALQRRRCCCMTSDSCRYCDKGVTAKNSVFNFQRNRSFWQHLDIDLG